MLNTSTSKVHMMYLLLLTDLNYVSKYSWTILVYFYWTLDDEIDFNQDNIGNRMLLL